MTFSSIRPVYVLLLALAAWLSVSLWPSVSYAVDESCGVLPVTVDGVAYRVYSGVVVVKCTAASDDASMSYTFGAQYAASDSDFMGLMDGRNILGAFSYDGTGTDPTAASDLAISDSDGVVLVSATGNGLNVIDNGTDHSFYFYGPDGASGYPKVHGNKPWTITWSNNAVNSGVNYLRLEVTGPRFVK